MRLPEKYRETIKREKEDIRKRGFNPVFIIIYKDSGKTVTRMFTCPFLGGFVWELDPNNPEFGDRLQVFERLANTGNTPLLSSGWEDLETIHRWCCEKNKSARALQGNRVRR